MASKIVTVIRRKGQPNEHEFNIPLEESPKKGSRYYLKNGTDGLHFDKLESVETFFKKKYPKAEIEIS